MFHSIAASIEILNVEAVEVVFGDTEEFWISAETTGPIGPESLPEVLLSLSDRDRHRACVAYDTAHPKFIAPDEGGEEGFLQWWYLSRRSEENPMSETQKTGPNFQPGDGLLILETKTPGRVTDFGGAAFGDGQRVGLDRPQE